MQIHFDKEAHPYGLLYYNFNHSGGYALNRADVDPGDLLAPSVDQLGIGQCGGALRYMLI